MQAKPIKQTLFLTGLLFFLFLAACAPKYIINGRVVDAETKDPVKGAAVAIRWYADPIEADSATTQAVESAQDMSDRNGNFNIPEHKSQHYVMGVYKEGYICWSSHNNFSNGKKEAAITRQDTPVEDGMEIHLERLKAGDSQDQHAGFTVLVAEEVTGSKKDPFYKAIKPLFIRWRDNLRKRFQKTFNKQPD
jgi:hypothetical protein